MKFNIFLFTIMVLLLAACKKESTTAPAVPNQVVTTRPSAIDTVTPPRDTATTVRPPVDTTTKIIVVLGSSTAAGTGASTPDSAWVNRLQARMNADKKKIKIINLSQGGFNTYYIMPTGYAVPAGRPQADTKKNVTTALSLRPDMVIINMPSNDVASNYTDDEILGNYRVLVKELDDKDVNYIITGTQPRNFSSISQRQRLKSLNDKMQAIYLTHLNTYYNMLASASYSISDVYSAGDGIHVNDKGHRIIYESFMRMPAYVKSVGY